MKGERSVMKKELLDELERRIQDLKIEFEQLHLIDSYSEVSQQNWRQDIPRSIRIKESFKRLEEIMTRIKIV